MERLWSTIDGNKRRNIKKAVKRGVEFREVNDYKDIKEFYRLILEVAKRDKFKPGHYLGFKLSGKFVGKTR